MIIPPGGHPYKEGRTSNHPPTPWLRSGSFAALLLVASAILELILQNIRNEENVAFEMLTVITVIITRSSATAKSTARASCLVGVLYDISREKIC